MTVFNYTQFEQWALQPDKKRPKATHVPAYLIYGDEYLCKKALKALLRLLLPGDQLKFNYEPVDGFKEGAAPALEKLNTYTLMGGRKVIGILDAQLSTAAKSGSSLLTKARDAWAGRQKGAAAKAFVRLLAASGLSWEDLENQDFVKSLKPAGLTSDDPSWMVKLMAHCREKQMAIPEQRDDMQMLLESLKKGFPPNHFLVMTTDSVDKRRVFYKTFEGLGLIIDCSVPKGDRAADRKIQQAMLRERATAILSESGKTLEPAAFQALYQKTGFELRGFTQNLEKLIQYCGDRGKITTEDVAAVLVRTKKDSVYEMTQAIADGKLADTLFYMQSLLVDAIHPLQLLAAIHNQVRKLLMAKAFVESEMGRVWSPACTYDQFRQQIMPAVVKFDRRLLARLEQWDTQLKGDDIGTPEKKKKKKAPKPATDLMLARNPNNAYPVFLILKKAGRFSMDDLLGFVALIAEADRALKTGARNPRLTLESLAMKICGPKHHGRGG